MGDLERRFRDDKAIRDVARRNVKADLANTRAALSGTGLVNRITERVGEGARDVFETAKGQSDKKGGIAAVLVGAFVLWIASGPLRGLFGDSKDTRGERDERDRSTGRAGKHSSRNDYGHNTN